MENSRIVWKNQKKMRTGYTTGSCAAAAAKAAAVMLLTGEEIQNVRLMTPAGILLYLEIEHIERQNDFVSCAVKKDSGDDPDVTNGVYVFAKVAKKENAYDESCFLTFKGWEKYGKKRIYINDYKNRTLGFIENDEVIIKDNQGNYKNEIDYAISNFKAQYAF